MKKYLLLAGVGFCCLSGTAWAELNCSEPPECDALGYTLTEDDCSNRTVLRCPFDSTQVFCVQSCTQIGYTATECLLGQQSDFCPFDRAWLKCSGKSNIDRCTEEGYRPEKTSTGNAWVACEVGTTRVYCPYDTGEIKYLKCEAKTTKEICKEAGYAMTGDDTCPQGQSKLNCPTDETYFKCARLAIIGDIIYVVPDDDESGGGSGGSWGGGGASSGGNGELIMDNPGSGQLWESVGYTDKDFTRPN